MKKLEVLPTYLYEFKLPDKLYDKLLAKANSIEYGSYINRENKPYFGKSCLTGGGLNKEKDWKFLNTYVNAKLNEVAKDVNYDLFVEKISTVLMWINKSEHMQWHHAHVHPWSILSGIIYVQGESGKTWFSRKNEYELDRRFRSICRDNTMPNQDLFEIVYKHEPKNGTMLIFPSLLKHSVEENTAQVPRVTISFNSFFDGEAGSINSLSYVNFKLSK